MKRCADFRLQPAIIIPKAFCGQALPGPARGVYSTPPDSLAGCKVYIYRSRDKGRGGENRGGADRRTTGKAEKEREGREGIGRGGGKAGRGREGKGEISPPQSFLQLVTY